MSSRFHQYKKKIVDEEEEKNEHLGMLAGKIGYLINVSAGTTKTWQFEERIIALEKDKEDPIPKSERKKYEFNPDIMLTVIRDEKTGKLMN